jgi:carbon-monoxide dehydrogenase small subunit
MPHSIDVAPGDTTEITLEVNGNSITSQVSPRTLLSDWLRHDQRLTGTHVGCEHGVCGACTIHIDGKPARSCLTLAVQADGCAITTIEGMEQDGKLHPVQQAFTECHALQCGFCTPGFIMAIAGFLDETDVESMSDAELREGIAGNVCRCTGYMNIVAATKRAAELRNAEVHTERVAR